MGRIGRGTCCAIRFHAAALAISCVPRFPLLLLMSLQFHRENWNRFRSQELRNPRWILGGGVQPSDSAVTQGPVSGYYQPQPPPLNLFSSLIFSSSSPSPPSPPPLSHCALSPQPHPPKRPGNARSSSFETHCTIDHTLPLSKGGLLSLCHDLAMIQLPSLYVYSMMTMRLEVSFWLPTWKCKELDFKKFKWFLSPAGPQQRPSACCWT